MSVAATPIYLDWNFWTAIVAVLALVLSLLPPVRTFLKRPRLSMQPYDRLNITHWLGNPNVNLHVELVNTGGRPVRVRSLVLELTVDDGDKLTLPAQTFSRADGTPGSFLFTSFGLDPDKEWANVVGFYAPFSMTDERISRQMIKELKTDIDAKLRDRPAEVAATLEEADAAHAAKAQEFFKSHNRWRAGEYAAVLKLACEPVRASLARRFRFTLFEADVQELEERTSRYMYGAGVYFNDAQQTEVYPRIKDLS